MKTRELNAILAALAFFQESGQGNVWSRSREINEILTDGDCTEPGLNDQELSELSMKINLGDYELVESQDFPYGSTVKLQDADGVIGWAHRDENNQLVSAYSKVPLDASMWTVVMEKSLPADQADPVNQLYSHPKGKGAGKYHGMKLAGDWKGKRVRAARDITNNGGQAVKAGTQGVVTGISSGLDVTFDHCCHCGTVLHVRKLNYSAVELA